MGELVLLRDCPKSDQENPESCPTSQPQILPAPQLSFLPSALTLSFCLSPSSSLPQPGFLIHSFPFITETHSCMGEKHLPAESGDRQRGRGVEGESELEGACWGRSGSEGALPSLQEGLKPAGGRPQSLHPPRFPTLVPGIWRGYRCPFVQGRSEAGFPPLRRGEAPSHKRRITLARSSRGRSEARGAGPGHLHR